MRAEAGNMRARSAHKRAPCEQTRAQCAQHPRTIRPEASKPDRKPHVVPPFRRPPQPKAPAISKKSDQKPKNFPWRAEAHSESGGHFNDFNRATQKTPPFQLSDIEINHRVKIREASWERVRLAAALDRAVQTAQRAGVPDETSETYFTGRETNEIHFTTS
jgi:hypothetical protein